MDRRAMFCALGAAAATSAVLPAFALEEHHNHGGGAKHQSLIEASSACSTAAELCVTHCVAMLAEGAKDLEACAGTSREVAVVCGGLRSLAAQSAPHLAAYAKTAAEICRACEAECRKHPQHPTCKACADACAACAAECAKVA